MTVDRRSRPVAGRRAWILLPVFLVVLVAPLPVRAQDPDLDEVLRGFSEERSAPSSTTTSETNERVQGETGGTAHATRQGRLAFSGSLTLSAASNVHPHKAAATGTDYSGLSRLRLTLDLGLEARLAPAWDATVRGRGFYDAAYSINRKGRYTDAVLDSLEEEAELREAFLRGKVLSWLDLKVGRQIVVWGTSDDLRVTDVLNPLDNREPGMTDLEDLRLPVAMAKLDGYGGPWDLSVIAIPEIRFDKNPPYGSDFYPSTLPPPPETVPDDGGSNTEYAGSLHGTLSGWDLSLYSARIYNDRPSARFTSLFPFPQIAWVHDRISMRGAAVDAAAGNWLFKAEAAQFSGLRFAAEPDRPRRRIDGLLGAEYAGFAESLLSVEVVHRRLRDVDAALTRPPDLARQDAVEIALRAQRDLLHARLHLTLVTLRGGWNGRDGALQRLSGRYEVTDRLSLNGGFVIYRSGELPELQNVGKNDRVFLEAKYAF